MLGPTPPDRRTPVYQGGLGSSPRSTRWRRPRPSPPVTRTCRWRTARSACPASTPSPASRIAARPLWCPSSPLPGPCARWWRGRDSTSWQYNLATAEPAPGGLVDEDLRAGDADGAGPLARRHHQRHRSLRHVQPGRRRGPVPRRELRRRRRQRRHHHRGHPGLVQLRVRAPRAHRRAGGGGGDGAPARHHLGAGRHPVVAAGHEGDHPAGDGVGLRHAGQRRRLQPALHDRAHRGQGRQRHLPARPGPRAEGVAPGGPAGHEHPPAERAERHRHRRPPPGPAGRRQDRHDAGLHRRLVRGLHARPVHRGVGRGPGGQVPHRPRRHRHHRRALPGSDLGRVHERLAGGASRQPVPGPEPGSAIRRHPRGARRARPDASPPPPPPPPDPGFPFPFPLPTVPGQGVQGAPTAATTAMAATTVATRRGLPPPTETPPTTGIPT